MTFTSRNLTAELQYCQQGGLPYPSSCVVILQKTDSSIVTVDAKEKAVPRSWAETNRDDNDKITNTSPQSSSKRRKIRRVAFDESTNASYSNVHMEKDDVPSLWYSSSEYHRFKAEYVKAARKIIRSEHRGEAAKGNRDSIATIVQKLHSACYEADQKKEDIVQSSDFKRLQSLMSSSTTHDNDGVDANIDYCDRVGMEKVTIAKLRINRRKNYEELVNKILTIQETHWRMQEHWQERLTYEEEQIMSQVAIQAIALVARQISEPACLFAAIMAESLTTSRRDGSST